MDPGFEEATNHNLPVVNSTMVFEFYRKHPDFDQPEVKNVKTSSATRESYGDNAVGFVQVKRENNNCYVRGKITPEHKVHKGSYSVKVLIDEAHGIVKDCLCVDCSASAGSCKHSIAFLLWLHRRSEEESVTSVECYWKKSKLAKVGTSIKYATLKDLCDKQVPTLPNIMSIEGKSFKESVVEKGKEAGAYGTLFMQQFPTDSVNKVCLHKLSLRHFIDKKANNWKSFLDFAKKNITEEDCAAVEKCTRSQSKSPEWFKVRYGRITASKLHEASKCQTMDGSLVAAILGGSRPITTPAIERGKVLEEQVLKEVAKKLECKIKPCGFYVYADYPIFGASPDGITDTHVIEVKCPMKDTTKKNYLDDKGKICAKPFAQMQLQMYLAERRKGYFCVAAPNFEETKNVNIVEVGLDLEYCTEVLNTAAKFWTTAIFPNLFKSM